MAGCVFVIHLAQKEPFRSLTPVITEAQQIVVDACLALPAQVSNDVGLSLPRISSEMVTDELRSRAAWPVSVSSSYCNL